MSRLHRRALVALALVALVTTAVAAVGKPGGGAATLVLSPDPAPAWGTAFTGRGCGHRTGVQANVVVDDGSSQAFFPTGVDAGGCIAFTYWTGAPGITVVRVYQNAKGGRQSLVASASLTVR